MLFYLKREKYSNKTRRYLLVNPNGIRLQKQAGTSMLLWSSFHYNIFSSLWPANGQLIILHPVKRFTWLHSGITMALMHMNLIIKERLCFGVFFGLLAMCSSLLRAGWMRAEILGMAQVAQHLQQGCVLIFHVPLWPIRGCRLASFCTAANAFLNQKYFPNVPRHTATKHFMA